ncbi:hypothetical protein CEW88_08495 [Alloyangia pacifica]|uniref:Uncharacterized protein n=1 Tax=Alloyangia pacifica TaxID=311180 RepID=A0A2U8HFE5_9RHOB|nr:hypothetical protein [Alloyangia pacifica]AWI83716.1 hypothetical protein CEW88_08495 [Alloyangia pacifica]
MDGAVSWTEMGSERGLDPLAMINVIQERYQSLLPGFSSVTTRLRNYSFYSWLVAHYAQNIHDASRTRFHSFLRRCEALYALASAQDSKETGVAARLFANDYLRGDNPVIDFIRATDEATPAAERYMDAKSGVFYAVYFRQMVDFGLLDERTEHGLPVPTEAGAALAAAYNETLGSLSATFFAAADAGTVSRQELAPMVLMRPSALDQDSTEAELLRDLLLGSDGRESSLERRKTLLLILKTARFSPAPVAVDDLRWSWLETVPEGELQETHAAWRHYQTGDTVRVVYEALMRHATRELMDHPLGLALPALNALALRDIPDVTLKDFFFALEAANDGRTFREPQGAALRDEAPIADILAPLARLCTLWRGDLDQLKESFPDKPGYQTGLSELRWLIQSMDQSASGVLQTLIGERVLRRHLEVAARKFHLQKKYTYLVEI